MTTPIAAVAIALCGLAVLVWPCRDQAGAWIHNPGDHQHQRRTLRGTDGPGHDPGAVDRRSSARRFGLATCAGAGVALLVGGLSGVLVGLGVLALAERVLARVQDPQQRRLRERRRAELAGSLDLFAVCLRSGLPPPRALAVVAELTDGPLSTELRAVAALQALGVPPAAAWAEHTADPVLGAVARAVARTADSGAALAGSVERVATDTRAELRQTAEAAARRAGVTVLAPLGLCFLPAFVCLGVIPIVLGIASDVLW